MNKFKDMSVSVRHVITAAWIAVPLIGGMSVGAFRLSAVEEGQTKQDVVIEEIRDAINNIKIKQAVSTTEIKNVKEELGRQSKKLDTILERLPDRR